MKYMYLFVSVVTCVCLLLQLNSTLDSRQLSLQSSFEVQLSSLRQFVMEQVDSRLTEAMVIEVVRKLLTDQLSAAKKEWIAEVCRALCLSVLVLYISPYPSYTHTLNKKWSDIQC